MSAVALVTGASRRIGRAIALEMARMGNTVAIHTRKNHHEDAVRLCDEIRRSGREAKVFTAELVSRTQVSHLIGDVSEQLGPVSVLVNNASLFEPDGATDFGAESWDMHMAVNLEAPLALARDMANAMPEGMTGNVINLIDQRVWRLNPNFFTYTLSKSALWTATRTMAMAFAPRVRVNAIGPGPTLRNARQNAADFQAQVDALPLKNGPSPEEIARAVRFLIETPSMTGQMLALDGGQHLAWETPDIAGIPE
ncbi:MAG: SDR family oxidoreductase [Rhodobiaceae bacterium]|nr:SDR family oxidoreductase [Rhodobiaceae bacterium]MCC0049606.1 SDR family oxidoreductase [Rhodobiaceae bacterium]